MSWAGAVCVCGLINWLLNSEPGEKLWKFPAKVQSGTAACAALAGREAPGFCWQGEAVQPTETQRGSCRLRCKLLCSKTAPRLLHTLPRWGGSLARLNWPQGPTAQGCGPVTPSPPVAAAGLALQTNICKEKRYLLLVFFFSFF